jgi:hypothetical protein
VSIFPSLFGGRPMRMIEVRFIDQVSGKPVCLYEDRMGRRWLSDGAWGASRIKPSNPLAMYERSKP